MNQRSYSDAALEMRRYLKELRSDHYWTTHLVFDEDLVIEELAARLVDTQSVQEVMDVFEDEEIDRDDYDDMEDFDLIPDCAIQALVAVGTDLVVDVLIRTLTNPKPGRIVGAATALGGIGNHRAVEPLIKTLQHPHPIVRASVARVLGQIGDAAAQEALVARLADQDGFVQEMAAAALSKMGDERALERLVTAFYRSDLEHEESLPLIIIKALGRIHSAEPVLLDILNKTPRVLCEIREEAMLALAKGDSHAAFGPLIEVLSEEDRRIKITSARALGMLGDARAVERLIPLLEDSDPGVRGTTAQALGLLKDPRALPALQKTSQTDHEYCWTGTRVSDLARRAITVIETCVG
jgi:HEAT repeat protein